MYCLENAVLVVLTRRIHYFCSKFKRFWWDFDQILNRIILSLEMYLSTKKNIRILKLIELCGLVGVKWRCKNVFCVILFILGANDGRECRGKHLKIRFILMKISELFVCKAKPESFSVPYIISICVWQFLDLWWLNVGFVGKKRKNLPMLIRDGHFVKIWFSC